MLDPARRYPSFRRLWFSGIFFYSAYWSQLVILGWLAFDLTKSEFAVALFGSIGFAPFFLGPIGGLIADHVHRPRLLIGTQCAALTACVVVALLVTIDAIAFWHVVIAGFFTGIAGAPTQPARFTLIMDFVGRDSLSSANALNMASNFGGRIVAPALAGVLIGAYGADVALGSAACWYVPSLLILATVRDIERDTAAAQWQLLGDLVDGFRVFLGNRELRAVLIATMAANVFAWPIVQSFFPIFAEDVLEVGATGLGLIVALNGSGALLGAMAIASLGDFPRKGRLFLFGTGCFGLFMAAFAVSGTMSLALPAIFAAGVASSGFGVLQSTLAMLLAPEYARARVAGVMMLVIGVQPVAMLLQGAIASYAGVVATTLVSGLLLATVIAWLARASPGLRRL